MSTIYVPGRGAMSLAHRRVDQAVREYDERLFAAANPHNGIDTVFIKMSPFNDWINDDFGTEIAGQRCVPVLGFSEGFPEPHYVIERLARIDAQRRGSKILDEINNNNERIRKEARYRASEAAGEAAEVMESVMHRLGRTPYSRSFAKRAPKQRG